jgi:sugar lactone lactonase YvrE
MDRCAEIVTRPPGFPRHDRLGEGPHWDEQDQALYWVDIVGRRVMEYRPEGARFRQWAMPSVSSFAAPTTRGDLIVALRDGLHRLDPETGAITHFTRPDLDDLNRSNDCRIDPSGALWLGTMGNNIGEDGASIALRPEAGGLYRIGPDKIATTALVGVGISNALAFSPDGRRMTFADTTKGVIWTFAVDPDTGELSDRKVLLEGGPGYPDGAAMDEDGCLWNARWGAGLVIRITPDGRIDGQIELAASQPSCCAFGGEDRRTLYITSARQDLEAPTVADGALFAVDVNATGVPMARFAG